MITTYETLFLPEGTYSNVPVDKFTKYSDLEYIQRIYRSWRELTNDLQSINARGINIPEGLSETLFCIITGCYRVNNIKLMGANTSFDCYSPVDNARVQVKACSIIPDLTSFGPHSVWDRLVFIDFYANGEWNGEFRMFEIPEDLVHNMILNASKGETFVNQQEQGRRPRLSLYNLVSKNNIAPFYIGNIYNL